MHRAVLSALLIVASGSFAQEPAKPVRELPGNVPITWHAGGPDRYALVRTEFDAKTRKVTFLVEAKTDLQIEGNDFEVYLFDADKVRIHVIEANRQEMEGGIVELLEPEDAAEQGSVVRSFLKGERLRVSFELPEAALWERVRHAVVGSRGLPSE